MDFEKKVVDNIVEKREQIRTREKKEEQERLEQEEEALLSKVDVPPASNADEEW